MTFDLNHRRYDNPTRTKDLLDAMNKADRGTRCKALRLAHIAQTMDPCLKVSNALLQYISKVNQRPFVHLCTDLESSGYMGMCDCSP